MFILDENQQQHLLAILREINNHCYDNLIIIKQQQQESNKIAFKRKKFIAIQPSPITGFNFANRQSLTEFILNCNNYFRLFFKYTTCNPSGLPQDLSSRGKNIFWWLSIFYNPVLYEHIDFEQMFGNEPIDDIENENVDSSAFVLQANNKHLKENENKQLNKTSITANQIVNGNINVTSTNLNQQHEQTQQISNVGTENLVHQHISTTSNHIYHHQQQQQHNHHNDLNNQPIQLSANTSTFHTQLNDIPQQKDDLQSNIPNAHHNDSSAMFPVNNSNNNNVIDQQQQNSINYQIIKDVTFISLLFAVMFYKLRNLFPQLVSRCEQSWEYLLSFERELETSFLHESFIEFLQQEFVQQRCNNERNTDKLRNELKFLKKMSALLDKELEQEIYNLVQLQNSTPIAINSKSNQISIATNITGLTLQSSNSTTIQQNQHSDSKVTTSNQPIKGARPCPICGKEFRNSYKLNRHLYVHKDPSEKPFVCNWDNCSYRSISKNDLNRHKMIHTGEKPYVCEIEGCEKRYSRADKLRHHKLNIHSKNATGMMNSKNSNSNKKEQICIWPGCNFQCSNKIDLKRHQLTHEAVKCDFVGCDKIFDKMDKLRRHREKDHQIKMETINDFTVNNNNNNNNNNNSNQNHNHTFQQQANITTINSSGVPISVASAPDISTVASVTSSQNNSNSNNNNNSNNTNATNNHNNQHHHQNHIAHHHMQQLQQQQQQPQQIIISNHQNNITNTITANLNQTTHHITNTNTNSDDKLQTELSNVSIVSVNNRHGNTHHNNHGHAVTSVSTATTIASSASTNNDNSNTIATSVPISVVAASQQQQTHSNQQNGISVWSS